LNSIQNLLQQALDDPAQWARLSVQINQDIDGFLNPSSQAESIDLTDLGAFFGINAQELSSLEAELSGELGFTLRDTLQKYKTYIEGELQYPSGCSVSRGDYDTMIANIKSIIASNISELPAAIDKTKAKNRGNLQNMQWIVNAEIKEQLRGIEESLFASAKFYLLMHTESAYKTAVSGHTESIQNERRKMAFRSHVKGRLMDIKSGLIDQQNCTEIPNSLLNNTSLFALTAADQGRHDGFLYGQNPNAQTPSLREGIKQAQEGTLLNEKDAAIEANAQKWFIAACLFQALPYLGTAVSVPVDARDIFSSDDSTMHYLQTTLQGITGIPPEYKMQRSWIDNVLGAFGLIATAVGLQGVAKLEKVRDVLRASKIPLEHIGDAFLQIAQAMGVDITKARAFLAQLDAPASQTASTTSGNVVDLASARQARVAQGSGNSPDGHSAEVIPFTGASGARAEVPAQPATANAPTIGPVGEGLPPATNDQYIDPNIVPLQQQSKTVAEAVPLARAVGDGLSSDLNPRGIVARTGSGTGDGIGEVGRNGPRGIGTAEAGTTTSAPATGITVPTAVATPTRAPVAEVAEAGRTPETPATFGQYESIRGKKDLTIQQQAQLAQDVMRNSGTKIDAQITMDRTLGRPSRPMSEVPVRESIADSEAARIVASNPTHAPMLNRLWTTMDEILPASKLLTREERIKILQSSSEYLSDLSLAMREGDIPNLPEERIFALIQENQRKLAHLTVVDKHYFTGSDHGVTHVLDGNMTMANKLMAQLGNRLTAKERVMIRQAIIDHDMGYTINALEGKTGSAFFDMTKDHPLFSAAYIEAHKAEYVEVFGEDGYNIIYRAVLDHSNAKKFDLNASGGKLVENIVAGVDCLGVTADVKMMSLFRDPEMMNELHRIGLIWEDVSVVRLERGEALTQIGAIRDRMIVSVRSNDTLDEPTKTAYIRALTENFSPENTGFAANRDIASYMGSFRDIEMVDDGSGGSRVLVTFNVHGDMQSMVKSAFSDKTASGAFVKAMEDYGLKLGKERSEVIVNGHQEHWNIADFAQAVESLKPGESLHIRAPNGDFSFRKPEIHEADIMAQHAQEIQEGMRRTHLVQETLRNLETTTNPGGLVAEYQNIIRSMGRYIVEIDGEPQSYQFQFRNK
jgi:hypothetical protein